MCIAKTRNSRSREFRLDTYLFAEKETTCIREIHFARLDAVHLDKWINLFIDDNRAVLKVEEYQSLAIPGVFIPSPAY